MHELLHSVPPTLQQATTDPRLYLRLSDTHMQVRDSLLWVTAPFSLVLVHKVLLCPPRIYLPVFCKFWLLYSGVNGDLLQEGLCHTQVCCTQSPSLWQFTADPYLHRRRSNTVLSQSLWGPRVLWTQDLFESSRHLWWEWGLILNENSPFLPSCWGFFALAHGLSPHSCSSAYHLTGFL